ncbi:MAG: response regulator transcription factor [Kiritimatiellae bacterium]|nr:response regulator transcription factor [Kiritimatiellia bacterium]
MRQVVIVDDHPMVRDGIAALLTSSRKFTVAATLGGGDGLMEFCARNGCPDAILMDIRMPGKDGFAVLSELLGAYPGARVLFLAGMPLREEEARARREGAKGYLPKSVNHLRLIEALETVIADDSAFIHEAFVPAPSELSDREMDVLRYLALGKAREEIAVILGISSETVKVHVKKIREKLDCANAAGAVSRAYELGILRP